MNLKRITKKDQLNLKKLYFDSIISIDESIYSQEQKRERLFTQQARLRPPIPSIQLSSSKRPPQEPQA